MSTSDGFSDEMLPLPRPGRSRTAAERLARGGAVAPPAPPPARPAPRPDPPAPEVTTVPPADLEAPADAPVAPPESDRGDESPPPATTTPDAGSKRPRRRPAKSAKRPAKASTEDSDPEADSATGDVATSVPESLVRRMDDDPRSRANILRAAFSMHALTVVEANPPPPAPVVEGMIIPRMRRVASESDPFVDVLFRLQPSERAVIDKYVADTPLSRSAFVTELLKVEFGVATDAT